MELASKGQLAYLVSDGSISYGMNYPFVRVIVSSKFANVYKIKTKLQLFGRAGRSGKSWRAEVFIPDETSLELNNYLRHPERFNEERDNMAATLNKFL